MQQVPLDQTQAMRAGDIMNRRVITLKADMSLQAAASLLLEEGITGAPVVDSKGVAVGVVSLTDIAQRYADTGGEQAYSRAGANLYAQGWEDKLTFEEFSELHIEDEETQVSDAMTPTVYTVSIDASVADLAKAMIAGRVHRLFVTDAEEIIGIITTLDLLRILAGPE